MYAKIKLPDIEYFDSISGSFDVIVSNTVVFFKCDEG